MNSRFSSAGKALKRAFCMLLLLSVVHPADASDRTRPWEAEMAESRQFLEGDRYREAETVAKKAVRLAQRKFGPGSPQMAQSLFLMGDIFGKQRMFSKAEPLQRQSLNIMEKRLGMNHPDLTEYLNALAFTRARRNDTAEAEELYRRALRILEKALGKNHPKTEKARAAIETLRRFHDQAAETDAAENTPTLLSVNTQVASARTPFSEKKWRILTAAMATLADEGNDKEGFAVAMEAARLAESGLGPDDPRMAEALTQAAGFLERMGEADEAMRLYAKSYEVLERAYGGDSIEASVGLDRMALLYENQENYAGAAAMAERSMAIWKENFGADHPIVQSRRKELEILKKKAIRKASVPESQAKASPPPSKWTSKPAVSSGDKTGEFGQGFAQTISRIGTAIRELPRTLRLDGSSGGWKTRLDRFVHRFTLPQWILIFMGIGGAALLLLKDWN